mgnify:CR=1 FL=1
MDVMDQRIADFARKWFAAISGIDERYDIERLEGKADCTHATLDAFVDDLCELVINAEIKE